MHTSMAKTVGFASRSQSFSSLGLIIDIGRIATVKDLDKPLKLTDFSEKAKSTVVTKVNRVRH